MACLSDNAALGHYCADRRSAGRGQRVKKLSLKSVSEDFVFNFGIGVPGAAQQKAAGLPLTAPKEGGLFYGEFSGAFEERGFDTVLRIDGRIFSASLYVNGNLAAEIKNTLITAMVRVDTFLGERNSIFLKIDANVSPEPDIIRAVSLTRLPKSRITDCRLRTRVGAESAELSADIRVFAGDAEAVAGGEVLLSVFDGGGREPVAEARADVPPFERNYWADIALAAEMKSARLWSLDDPHRYTVFVRFFRADGTAADMRRIFCGIRSLRLGGYSPGTKSGPSLLLNGVPVKLLGAAVQSTDAAGVKELKAAGFNAVRATGTTDPDFLEECDKNGLLVMCETDAGVGPPAGRRRRAGKAADPLDRTFALLGEMIMRFRNHAAVFCWSLGGRKPFGMGVIGEFVRLMDGTRAVNCEGDFRFAASNFFSVSDCGAEELEAVRARKTVTDGRLFGLRVPYGRYANRPFLLCGASAEPETLRAKLEIINSSERLLGMFINVSSNDDVMKCKAVFEGAGPKG